MNKKGQALVEFVIILPLIVFMLLATIDIGKIFYTKNVLENKLNDVVTMYQNDKNIDAIKKNLNKDVKKSEFSITEDNENTKIELTKEVEIITPGLNLIFKNPYKIQVKRVISNEN